MDLRIPPLAIKIMLESNPLKPRILVRRLAAMARAACEAWESKVSPEDPVVPSVHPEVPSGKVHLRLESIGFTGSLDLLVWLILIDFCGC